MQKKLNIFYAAFVCVLWLLFSAPLHAKNCGQEITAPRAVPVAAANSIAIATQNMERLLVEEKNNKHQTDAQRAEALSLYELRIQKFARHIEQVLNMPAVIAVQEVGNIHALHAVAAAIAQHTGTAPYQVVFSNGKRFGGINLGFLVRADLTVIAAEPLLATRRLDKSYLFDRPPFMLTLETAPGHALHLVNVHLKSLFKSDDPAQAPKTKRRRQRQADVLAEWVSFYLAKNPQAALMVLGDFNATADKIGGVDVLGIVQAEGLSSTDELIPAHERYSLVFECRKELLDHILVSSNLKPRVQSAAASRGNAGAPLRFAHDTSTPLRSSDHDAVVVYVAR